MGSLAAKRHAYLVTAYEEVYSSSSMAELRSGLHTSAKHVAWHQNSNCPSQRWRMHDEVSGGHEVCWSA